MIHDRTIPVHTAMSPSPRYCLPITLWSRLNTYLRRKLSGGDVVVRSGWRELGESTRTRNPWA